MGRAELNVDRASDSAEVTRSSMGIGRSKGAKYSGVKLSEGLLARVAKNKGDVTATIDVKRLVNDQTIYQ